MRTIFIPFLLLFICSCVTTTHVNYTDPNYLNSSEFNVYHAPEEKSEADIETNNFEDSTEVYVDSYTHDYDYSYSSRLRRFHRPMYHSNYYGGIYTDYYWYNHDPFYCGTSIYYGYNWYSPYYSYYNPYYYSHFYRPYYYGYYSYYSYPYYTYSNNYNNDGYAETL